MDVNEPMTEVADRKAIQKILTQIQRSYIILDRNFKELLGANEVYLRNWSLVDPINAVGLEKFGIEYGRLLHNYLASWGSYVDHIRRFCGKISNSEFQKSFKQEKENRKLDENTSFVKNLRNFELHTELPFVGVKLNYFYTPEGLTGVTCGVTKHLPSLKIDDLLNDPDWKEPSKTLLKRLRKRSPYIKIMPLIVNNHKVTSDFHYWIIGKIKSL